MKTCLIVIGVYAHTTEHTLVLFLTDAAIPILQNSPFSTVKLVRTLFGKFRLKFPVAPISMDNRIKNWAWLAPRHADRAALELGDDMGAWQVVYDGQTHGWLLLN